MLLPPSNPGGTADTELIEARDIFVIKSDPCTIEPGHWWRTARCLICMSSVGGDPVVMITLVSTLAPPNEVGQLPCTSYLAHRSHTLPPDIDLHDLAHRRSHRGCACPRTPGSTPRKGLPVNGRKTDG